MRFAARLAIILAAAIVPAALPLSAALGLDAAQDRTVRGDLTPKDRARVKAVTKPTSATKKDDNAAPK